MGHPPGVVVQLPAPVPHAKCRQRVPHGVAPVESPIAPVAAAIVLRCNRTTSALPPLGFTAMRILAASSSAAAGSVNGSDTVNLPASRPAPWCVTTAYRKLAPITVHLNHRFGRHHDMLVDRFDRLAATA